MDSIENDVIANPADFDSHEGLIQNVEPEAIADPEPTEELPERYRGKSAAEIIKMHQNAERELGRKGQELGELRKLVDKELTAGAPTKQTENQPKEQDDLEFFENPRSAIEKYLTSRPELQAFKEFQQQQVAAQVQAELSKVHPDFEDTVQSQDFLDWVQESPVRLELLAKADQSYDLPSANELLSTYKLTRQAQARDRLESSGKETRQRAMGDTGRGAVSKENTGNGKRVYLRQELMKMKMQDPDQYSSRQAEILQAYAEGRVR